MDHEVQLRRSNAPNVMRADLQRAREQFVEGGL